MRVLVVDASDQDSAVARGPDVGEHQPALDELGDVEKVGAGPRRGRKLHHATPFVEPSGGVPVETNEFAPPGKTTISTTAVPPYQDQRCAMTAF